jgi:hypothetical protein
MRPQGFGQVGNGLEDLGWNDMGFEPPKPVEVERDVHHDAFGEDVVEHPRAHPTGLTPVHSPVHDQQAEIVDRLNSSEDAGEEETDEVVEIFEAEEEPVSVIVAAAPIAAPAPAPAPLPAPRHARRFQAALAGKGKAAFTLRLDRERHLKLRLACAVDGRSAQQLVTEALDQLLERMPELDGLAAKAKRRG